MRKTICVCDACGKEMDTKKGIWKILVGFSSDSDTPEELPQLDLSNKEFCISCTEKVTRFLLGKGITIQKKTGTKKAAVDPKKDKPAEMKKEETKATAPRPVGKTAERTAAELPKRLSKPKAEITEKLSPENAMLLEQEIRFFLENGQKKAEIIPELMHSYRVSEEIVKQMIAQYEEMSGRVEGKLMERK